MTVPIIGILAYESVCPGRRERLLARIGVKVMRDASPNRLLPEALTAKCPASDVRLDAADLRALHLLINGLATTDQAANRGAFNHGGYPIPRSTSLASRRKATSTR